MREKMNPFVTRQNLGEKAKQWLDQIAPFNTHNWELDTAKTALMVIDMQRFFVEPGSPLSLEHGNVIIPTVKKLIEGFRKTGLPVIYTRHVHHPDGSDAGNLGWWWDGMIIDGSPESEITAELAPLPGEKIIFKHRYSSFLGTDLDTVLRGKGIKDIVISGVMTNLCCETTAREAFMRDYRVIFLADATGAATEEMHLATLVNLAFGFARIVLAGDILHEIGSGRR